MKKFITKSPAETKKFAAKIVKQLKDGEILGLVGELGSGKTVFVQGLAKALGIKQVVNSPTFVLMKIYTIRYLPFAICQLVHVDAYRINNPQELLDIGLQEYLGREDCLVVIEWADKVKKILPKKTIYINFQIKKNQRIIQIKNPVPNMVQGFIH